MVEIKEIKREIEGLSNVDDSLKKFEASWLSHPKKDKRNQKKSSLFETFQKLSPEDQKEVNQQLVAFYETFNNLKYGQFTVGKIRTLSSALVEMKLLGLRSDLSGKRAKYLHEKVTDDKFHSISTVSEEVDEFHESLKTLEEQYDNINDIIIQKLSLEHSLAMMEHPHGRNLKNLKAQSEKRREIVRNMARHFILMQEIRKKPTSP